MRTAPGIVHPDYFSAAAREREMVSSKDALSDGKPYRSVVKAGPD